MPANIRIPLMIACVLLVAPVAAAQGGAWHGQDNEFGSIRTPYALDMQGERVNVEAKIVLRKNYEDKESRFFMFGFDVRNTPLDVTFDHLIRSDTGADMPCYKTEGDRNTQMKCFVDLKHMPEPGTEIIMRGTVGANKAGMHQVGVIVLPFTYTWEKVHMSNGLDAELYAHSSINVHAPTSSGPGGKSVLSGGGNSIPASGTMLAVVGLSAAVVGLAAFRRKA